MQADGPAPPPADAPSVAPTGAPVPRWQSLSNTGLPDHAALDFDLRVADDGTPFLLISKGTTPGLAGITIVLRYDGSAWQQLGADLPSIEYPVSFVVTADGVPQILVAGAVQVFQQGRWQPLAAPAPPSVLTSTAPVCLARDGQGRLYAFARAAGDDDQLGVMRLSGGRWRLLGPPDSFGVISPSFQLAADRDTAYVATTATDGSEINVRRWDGSAWVTMGGGSIKAFGGAFAVSSDGTAYFVSEASLGIRPSRATATQPWMDLPVLYMPAGVSDVLPDIALGRDGALHIAYAADRDPGPDIVPGPLVTLLVGDTFVDLPVAGLDPSLFDHIKVRIAPRAGGEVVYVAYSREMQVVVKRIER